jgi:hypothetical protein
MDDLGISTGAATRGSMLRDPAGDLTRADPTRYNRLGVPWVS